MKPICKSRDQWGRGASPATRIVSDVSTSDWSGGVSVTQGAEPTTAANSGQETVESASSAQPALEIVPLAIREFAQQASTTDRTPRVLIDGQCNVLWRSSEADGLLQPPMPLWIAGGRVHAEKGAGAKTWPSFVETVDEEGERLLLTGSEPGAWVLLHGWARRIGEHRVIFLKCSPSWPLRDVVSSGLAADFGLTRTECLVLDEFARLAKPTQIAKRLNVSVSTVRSHLKQIHTKMGVNSSVHLIGITRAYTDD